MRSHVTHHRFLVESDDTELCVFVRQWFLDNLPLPPDSLTFRISVGDVSAGFDSPPIFQQPATSFYRGPDESMIIEWEGGLGTAVLDAAAPDAEIRLSTRAREHLAAAAPTFFLAVATLLYRRVGWHHLHAASLVDPQGRGWLLAGNSGSGKSTTSALLASHGWTLGGDDGVFLSREGTSVVAHPIRKKLALRKDSVEMLAALDGDFNPARGKTEFVIAHLPDSQGFVKPRFVAFLSIDGKQTRIDAVGGAKTLAQLVSWSAWVALEPRYADEHLQLLADLGRQADCYTIGLAKDVLEDPDVILNGVE